MKKSRGSGEKSLAKKAMQTGGGSKIIKGEGLWGVPGVFDACQVLTWKGKWSGLAAGYNEPPNWPVTRRPFIWAWARGGGGEASTTVAGPALGCGFLEDEAVERRALTQVSPHRKPIWPHMCPQGISDTPSAFPHSGTC